MSCEPIRPVVEAVNPPPIVPPAPGGTLLIRDLAVRFPRTIREETDAVGAMRRGLREYLSQAEKTVAGQKVRLLDVFEEWATSEDEAVRYPSAAVLLADGKVTYDGTQFAPKVLPEDKLPDGRYVIKTSEATTMFRVEVHCDNPGDRLAMSMLLEETLNPVDFMYGFALYCPHYFGQTALFSVESAELVDTPETARHGLRPLHAMIAGSISVVRPRGLPLLKPQLQLGVEAAGTPFTVPTGPRALSQGSLMGVPSEPKET